MNLIPQAQPCTWFVGRHEGSADWIKTQNITIDRFAEHLHKDVWPAPGDTVIGTLPIHIVARLNRQGVRFKHLKLTIDPHERGNELNVRSVRDAEPELIEFLVMQIHPAEERL